MRNRRGQFDMAHAFASDFSDSHFYAAFFANDAFVLHALILAAKALIILHRTKDACAEQAVPLWLERAVVNGFWLFNFAK